MLRWNQLIFALLVANLVLLAITPGTVAASAAAPAADRLLLDGASIPSQWFLSRSSSLQDVTRTGDAWTQTVVLYCNLYTETRGSCGETVYLDAAGKPGYAPINVQVHVAREARRQATDVDEAYSFSHAGWTVSLTAQGGNACDRGLLPLLAQRIAARR